MNPYTRLAKQTIKTYITEGKITKPPASLPKKMLTQKSGVFVSIYKKQKKAQKNKKKKSEKELRGCIGTFLPTQKNIAQEIIQNAISAATKDPRFSPIKESDIEQIVCSIDLISQPKQLSNLKNHNPKKDGLIVRSLDGRLGLLLPDLDGVDTVEKQFLICCTKGGINPKVDTPILYQFQVERHKEK